ncbi:MAG: Rid family detoxifying hydrolase [Rhodothalassiaceae bacterium]
MRLALSLLCALVLTGSAWSQAMFWSSEPFRDQDLPFSEAVRVGDTLYLAGTLGVNPATVDLVPGGIEAETRQLMDNIGAVLHQMGRDYRHLVYCTVFMADMDEWDAMNEVYKTYFEPGKYPARAAVEVSGLALDARVELQCIATLLGE